MKLLGITGGVGMGKSTSGQLLGQRGVEVIDTDEISRHLTKTGLPAFLEIVQRFGPSVLATDGQLDRAQLAQIVFSEKDARADLESILHPRIQAAWQEEARKWQRTGCATGAVLIPLLFETGVGSLFDAIVCIACSEASQQQRLAQRGWTENQIRQRRAAQWPVEKKIALSGFVVWTDTTMEAHAAQLGRVLRQPPLTS